MVLRAEVDTQAAGSFNAVVATVIAWRGRRPIRRIVKPYSFIGVFVDSNIVARSFEHLVLRRAAAVANTKTLSKVVFATMTLGRAIAIITWINVGTFISAR